MTHFQAAFSSEIGKDKSALIYKIQSHRVKPEDQQNYQDLLDEHIVALHEDKNLPQTLVGSFQVTFGTEDEVIHIWKYSGGYAALQKSELNVEAKSKYRGNWQLNLSCALSQKHEVVFIFKILMHEF